MAAATESRTALEAGPIRVRMGIHTGEPLKTDEGYVGMDVHRAARIAAAAHGGQIVLSETTRRLLENDASIRDLGEHRLKDLVHAERLYQLGDGDFPPLRTLDATNLPLASSPLVGREREVEELVAMLSNGTRLLTLTGPGGTGKTRLALQVAAELVGTQRDGVFWVPLVGLATQLSTSGFADDQRATTSPDSSEEGSSCCSSTTLSTSSTRPQVSAVLGAGNGVRALVTSRAPLRVAGEQEYRLEPLPVTEAAALFAERARGRGEVELDSTVEAICRRLGLPLAVELAAARTSSSLPRASSNASTRLFPS